MQVHRLSENTIQVTMDADELKARGITMLDLLGNKSQIQNFFYEILKEVDTDHTFAKDDPVTFQVMPSGTGLELLISKVSDKKDTKEQKDNSQLRQLLEGLSDLDNDSNDLSTNSRRTQITDKQTDSTESVKITNNRRVYRIKNIDLVVALADALRVEGLASSLYTYLHQYYLDLAFLDDNYVEMKPEDAWAIASEFGNGMDYKKFKKIKPKTKQLLAQDALGNLRHYFAKL